MPFLTAYAQGRQPRHAGLWPWMTVGLSTPFLTAYAQGHPPGHAGLWPG
jgi:hypothetical protein